MRLCQRRSWIATCLSHPGTSALSGGLTKKWEAAPADSPKRDYSDVVLIAEMVSRFDVVGVQEVRGDLRALRYLLKALGPEWGFTLTDVTKGDAGNNERMAFLFDTRRVRLSGLACELVVPVEEDPAAIDPDAFNRQFARTPYRQLPLRRPDVHPRHAPRRLRKQPRTHRRAARDRRVALRLGRTRRRVEPQPDRARRLQHRPPRRSPLRRLHLDRPHARTRPQRRPTHHLPVRQRQVLR